MMEGNLAALVDFNNNLADFGNTVAHPAIFYGTGKSFILGFIVCLFDTFQCFLESYTCCEHLARSKHATDIKGVVVAELPSIKSAFFAKLIN